MHMYVRKKVSPEEMYFQNVQELIRNLIFLVSSRCVTIDSNFSHFFTFPISLCTRHDDVVSGLWLELRSSRNKASPNGQDQALFHSSLRHDCILCHWVYLCTNNWYFSPDIWGWVETFQWWSSKGQKQEQ